MGKANGKTFNCIQKTLGCFWKTNKGQKMKFLLMLVFFLLVACLGPSLLTINGLKITASDVITAPHKIEALGGGKNGN